MPSDNNFTGDVSRRALLTTGVATAGVLTLGTGGIGAETSTNDEKSAKTASNDEQTAESVSADKQREFAAQMAPENAVQGEDGYVPYDDPDAQGEATFQLNDDGDALSWTVSLSNMRCVIGCHIHEGGPDENGSHLAELFNLPEPSGEIDGVFRENTFGEGDSCGADKNNCLPEDVTFDELLEKMRAGNTYAQVHAVDSEVIRGQIE